MKNSVDLSELYSVEVLERFERLKSQFPDLMDLAVSIKKIPSSFVEKGKKPTLRLRLLLSEELRENTNRLLKGQISPVRMRSFIKKTKIRVKNALSNNKDRDELADKIINAQFISSFNKSRILKLLSK